MMLEGFFEKFDTFADAPGAVAKLRELVLELAVRGGLSERLLSDQTDDAWSRFGGEHDAHITGNEFGPPPFEIPNVWRWVCLNTLGQTKVRNSADDATRVSFIPMALIPAGYGHLVQQDERTWSEVKKAFTHFANDDVVMAKITPCFENGKSAVMRSLTNGIGAGTTELHVFRRNTDAILPEFVLIYLKTLGFISRGESRMTGSAGQKRVPHDYFAYSPFPLPPPAEQKRIVSKVDELMALCDRLEAQQQERETRHAALARASLARFADAPTPENLEYLFHPAYAIAPGELRKAVLTLAVRGRLVRQDPGDEAAAATFPQLAAAALRPSSDGLPENWLRVPLGNIGDWRGGGTPAKTRPDFWHGAIPWVSPKDMKVLHISDAQDHISEGAVADSSVRMIPSGSLLMVVRGMILARAFPVAITTSEVTINQDMKALLPLEPRIKEYLLIALRAFEPDILAAIERSTHGTCKLETKFLQHFTIPIPPLIEQFRIVAKVDQLLALIDQLESRLDVFRTATFRLLDALVSQLIAQVAPRGNKWHT